jgi:hypothetical protein
MDSGIAFHEGASAAAVFRHFFSRFSAAGSAPKPGCLAACRQRPMPAISKEVWYRIIRFLNAGILLQKVHCRQ